MDTSHTPVDIGRVLQNAIIFDFKNWPLRPMNTDSIPQAVNHLFDLLKQRKVDYALVGGVALLTYVEGRNTQDIDLIVAVSSLKMLPEIKIDHQDIYFARGDYEGLQIDLLLTENPLFDTVRKKHTTERSFQEQMIKTATVEGLLLLKLYALPSLYRQGSFARVGIYENDVAVLLYDYPVAVGEIEKELSLHLSASDLAEVKSILGEIQRRIARYRHGQTPQA